MCVGLKKNSTLRRVKILSEVVMMVILETETLTVGKSETQSTKNSKATITGSSQTNSMTKEMMKCMKTSSNQLQMNNRHKN